jgi:hypothetical protein
MDIRDEIITGSCMYGHDGRREPIDWKNYAIKLEAKIEEIQKLPDEQIAWHLQRNKAIQNETAKRQGNLMARVFLRNVGAINNHDGNYMISEKDLFAWFENADYLRMYTEYDTI